MYAAAFRLRRKAADHQARQRGACHSERERRKPAGIRPAVRLTTRPSRIRSAITSSIRKMPPTAPIISPVSRLADEIRMMRKFRTGMEDNRTGRRLSKFLEFGESMV